MNPKPIQIPPKQTIPDLPKPDPKKLTDKYWRESKYYGKPELDPRSL